MRLPWLVLCLLWTLAGCSGTTRVIRLDTGRGLPVVHVPRPEGVAEPIELDEDEVKAAVTRLAWTARPSQRPQEAARRLFEVEPRSGSYLFDVRSRRITPLGPGEHLAAELPQSEVELTRAYLRWCERTGHKGDCLGLLATAAIGSTTATLGNTVRGLPGAAQAAVRAEAQAGMAYAAVGQVETVAVAADGFTFGLAPGAVAMSSRGTRGGGGASTGYHEWQTHRGMTKARGSAGPNKEWHHIVEQTEGNVRQFGPEAIHNTENVIALDKTLHDMVSAFYSRKYPLLTRSRDLTIREWLSTQSYAAQRDFGLLIIENIKKGVWR